MKRRGFLIFAGSALLLLGTAVLCGWAFDVPMLKTVLPGLASMSPNTAVCFVFTGAALLTVSWGSSSKFLLFAQACAAIVFAIGALSTLEHFANINLGLDELLFSDKPRLGEVRKEFPGRMSVITSFSFILTGLALFALTLASRAEWLVYLAQGLGFVIAVIGFIGLVGYTLNYHLLYSWYGYATVSLHSAVGFAVLGAGLWVAAIQPNTTLGDDVRMAGMSAGLLFVTAAASGILVMFAMQREIENVVAEGIQSTFGAHLLQLRTTLELRTTRAAMVTTRPNLLRNLRRLTEDPENQESRQVAQGVVESFSTHGFSAISILLPDGTEVARLGNLIDAPIAEAPITMPGGQNALLLWHDGLYLRHRLPLTDKAGPIGTVVIDQYLATTTESLQTVETLGKTAELLLCRTGQKDFLCFPTRLSPAPFALPVRSAGANFLAERALKGANYGKAVDYRGRHVFGSYGAVTASGLVAVLKLDAEEIYRPMGAQFQFTLLFIIGIAIGGAFLVWLKVRPIAALLGNRVKQRTAELSVATQALHASEQRERAILNSSLDAIISMDHDGNVLEFNPAAEQIFGYRNQDVVGKPLADLIVPPALRDKHREGLTRYLETGASNIVGRRVELAAMRADGTEFPVEVAIIHLRDHAMFTAYLRDISERRLARDTLAANADLSRSNTDLEQFAYIASHDLQEPLRMVASYVQLLSRRYKGKLDADADEFIGYAVDGAVRMQALLSDILSYSRIGESRSLETVDCNAALDTALINLKSELERSGGSVTRGELPEVNGVPTQINQLFQNLVGNALKYRGEAPPQVRVTAKPNVSEWVFEISDNGIGIAPEYHERIFRIFQRLHTREEYSGTGIGLPLCKKIVERHGGRIWVESAAGQGSTFYFTLPMREHHV